jgi:hypothetical protein
MEKQCASAANKSSLPDNVSAFGTFGATQFNSKARFVLAPTIPAYLPNQSTYYVHRH